jgi:hypothetical protein
MIECACLHVFEFGQPRTAFTCLSIREYNALLRLRGLALLLRFNVFFIDRLVHCFALTWCVCVFLFCIRACDRGQEAAVSLLLSFPGVDCNAADSEGMAPLHYAVLCDHTAIVSSLLASGANPHQADASGETPLDAADDATMKALLSSGAESA